ncbi:MAG: hypothetical protein WBD64_08650 [Candidatus Zixiibacteriota bacterium]
MNHIFDTDDEGQDSAQLKSSLVTDASSVTLLLNVTDIKDPS